MALTPSSRYFIGLGGTGRVGRFLSILYYIAVAGAFVFIVNEANAGLAIIIDTTENDTRGRGDLEYDLDFVRQDIYTLYPDARIILIRADRPSSIKRKLAIALHKNDDPVDFLYVKSHGDRLSVRNNSGTFDVYLDSPAQVETVFGPLANRWSQFPRVVFAGCAILEGLTPKSKEFFMRDFLGYLGIGYGSLYMNETDGNLASRIFIAQPMATDVPWRVQIQKIASKLLLPVGAAAALLRDQANNRGFLFRRSPRGVEILQDTYYNAMLSYLSEEERVALGESPADMRAQRILRRMSLLN